MNHKKYIALFLISAKHTLKHRSSFVGRLFFFVLIMFIFHRLWQVIGETRQINIDPKDMLWYLALTETIVLSIPLLYSSIEEDVKNGNLAYQVIRPISYVSSRFFEGLGDYLVRGFFIGCFGFVMAWLLTGQLPSDASLLWSFIPLFVLSGCVGISLQIITGITAFWIVDAAPIYWVWQKSLFVLGGMMLPLSIYPEWLQSFAGWTPFSYMLYGVASIAIGVNDEWLKVVLGLLFWNLVCGLAAVYIYHRAMNKLTLRGG